MAARRRALEMFLAIAAMAIVTKPTIVSATSFLRTEWRSTTPDGVRNRNSFIRGWNIFKNRRRQADPWNDPYSIDFFIWFHNLRGVHGGYHFHTWHAGLLLWFEQVIRIHSGDPQFSLPYLDFSTMPGRILPSEFRTTSSPLYYARRSSAINGGGAYPLSAVQWENAVRVGPYVVANGNPGLGGVAMAPQNETSSVQGTIQASIHAGIHNGTGGDMVNLATAPNDPLFYLLHGWVQMLVRFWRWRGGNYPDTDPNWINQVFRFPNANGDAVNQTVSQILSADYPYKYEAWPTFTTTTVASSTRAMQSLSVSGPAEQLAIQSNVSLLSRSTRISLPLKHEPRSGLVLLTAEAVTCSTEGVFHEVYVNVPKGAEAGLTASSPRFAGIISSLSHGEICGGPSTVLDITRQLGSGSKLDLLLIPQPAVGGKPHEVSRVRTLFVRG